MSSMIQGIAGMSAANAQSRDYKSQARMEAEAAKDREVQRTRKLREVLASNRANAASRGVASGQGSAGVINERSVDIYEEDQAADKKMTQARVQSLRAQAKASKRTGQINLAGSLFATGEQAHKEGWFK